MGLKSMFKSGKLDGVLMRKDVAMELFRHFRVIKVIGKGTSLPHLSNNHK
jgi:hypothetical protein